MCCRILNSNNPDIPVTGRNMNWLWTMSSDLYVHPKGIAKSGISETFAKSQQIPPSNVFSWTAKYASISCIMHGQHQGNTPKNLVPYDSYELACGDGINEVGLVVNAMFNNETDFGENGYDCKLLSTLRWGQFVLDSYSTVKEAIAEMAEPPYQIIDQGMPDNSEMKGQFFLCISDSLGDSAVIEYKGHEVIIHSDREYKIATNQPYYEAQLKFCQYWNYQWGMSEYPNKSVQHVAPGGYTAPEVFQKATYNLTFTAPMETAFLVTAQTKTLLASVAKPLNFNPRRHKKADSRTFYCIWTTIGVHEQKRFYFTNAFIGNYGYLELGDNSTECIRVQVSSQNIDELEQFEHLNGNLQDYTIPCDSVPFKKW